MDVLQQERLNTGFCQFTKPLQVQQGPLMCLKYTANISIAKLKLLRRTRNLHNLKLLPMPVRWLILPYRYSDLVSKVSNIARTWKNYYYNLPPFLQMNFIITPDCPRTFPSGVTINGI